MVKKPQRLRRNKAVTLGEIEYYNICRAPEHPQELGIFKILTLGSRKAMVVPIPHKPWTVYILRCRDASLYTGVTNDLKRRVEQHQKGIASRYTRARLPVVVVYYQAGFDQSSALKREVEIKKWSRLEKLKFIKKSRKKSGLG